MPTPCNLEYDARVGFVPPDLLDLCQIETFGINRQPRRTDSLEYLSCGSDDIRMRNTAEPTAK